MLSKAKVYGMGVGPGCASMINLCKQKLLKNMGVAGRGGPWVPTPSRPEATREIRANPARNAQGVGCAGCAR